ncbi:ABC transporter substrate-binding protein [Demetria terragena]|uniref:ABC transporter substrate-binding protein n=1 Tax=Demetria terragena TaxID=63959 RepID=UPI00036CA0C9|nr:ABC transporter substrate-binding protein [Demetria terragena]
MKASVLHRNRHVALPALLIALLMVLTACSSTPEPGSSASGSGSGDAAKPASSGVPAGEGSTTYPLTLKTWAGSSELKKRPERVAVFGFSPNLDALEALNFKPVYTITEEVKYPWRDQAWMKSIETVDTRTRRDPINFEGIKAAKPDLIIAPNALQSADEYKRLASIAPVLDNPTQVPGEDIDWRETQRMIGKAVDLPKAANAAITKADKATADVAKKHPEVKGKTITIATEYTGQIEYYTIAGSTTEELMVDMGFKPNPLAKEFVKDDTVSNENVGKLDGDVLMMFYVDPAAKAKRDKTPLFKALDPVKEKHYIGRTSEQPGAEVTWVLRRGASATSLPWATKTMGDWFGDLKL